MSEHNQSTINPIFTRIYKVLLSFFGTGYAPKAPGTVGSIASIPLVYFFEASSLSLVTKLVTYIFLTLVAVYMAQSIQKAYGLKDPQWIVLDEVLGMLFGSLAMSSVSWQQLLILLITFRFFDIIKFWPASYFDKLDHGAGTILDDVVSGGFTAFVLFAVNNFI